jgi:hypothetical protein
MKPIGDFANELCDELAGLITGRQTIAITQHGAAYIMPLHTHGRRSRYTADVLAAHRKLAEMKCTEITIQADAESAVVSGLKPGLVGLPDSLCQIFIPNVERRRD